jgi:hypothetical protein
MKITVIKKAATKKPSNYCPWWMDELQEKKN